MNQDRPKISVLMPVYNAESYVQESIESVLSQSFTDWELIVIDDGSTDGSAAICDLYAEKDPRVLVRHTANHGVSTARNLAFSLARGEWIAFLDSDDYLESDMLHTLWEHALCCDVVIAGYREIPRDKRYQAFPSVTRLDRLNQSPEDYIRIDRSFVLNCLHAKLFRKVFIRHLFREDQPFAEDTFFLQDNLFAAEGIVFLPDLLYVYRRRTDPSSLHNTQERRLETSHALMHAALSFFPESEAVRDHLTGKLIIRTFNHLLRSIDHCRSDHEKKELIETFMRNPLFTDPYLHAVKPPLPELFTFWSAVLSGESAGILGALQTASRTIPSDSPQKISVIVPVLNMQDSLAFAVESVLAQTHTHWELVIVDDGSTDQSGAIADAYMQKDARIRVIHQENAGTGAARNAAMSHVTGEWLAFLDADDVYLPDSFEQMLRFGKQADLVACAVRMEQKRIICQPYDHVRIFESLPAGKNLDLFWANLILPVVWGKIYRRHMIREQFVTDITYGEDAMFNLKVFPDLKRFVVIPEIGYLYKCHRERLDRGMLTGARRLLEAAAEWLPHDEVILRRVYIAFIRQARRFALNILDSDMSCEQKTEELVFCSQMTCLPSGLDHEEFLFPVNLQWWEWLKAGKFEQAVSGLRDILEEKRRQPDVLYPDGWTFAPRE